MQEIPLFILKGIDIIVLYVENIMCEFPNSVQQANIKTGGGNTDISIYMNAISATTGKK